MASVIINNIENRITKEEIREKYKNYCVMRDGPYDENVFKMSYYGTKINDNDDLQYYVNNATYDSKNNTFTSDLDGYFVRICDCIPNFVYGETMISDGDRIMVSNPDDLLFIETDNFLPSSRLYIRYVKYKYDKVIIFKAAKVYNDCSDIIEYYTDNPIELKDIAGDREKVRNIIKNRELLIRNKSDKIVYTFPSAGLTILILKEDTPRIVPSLKIERAM